MDMESMAVEDSQKEGNIFDTINNFTRRPITDILDTVFAYQTVKVGDDTSDLQLRFEISESVCHIISSFLQ
jgi:hypothetical protein